MTRCDDNQHDTYHGQHCTAKQFTACEQSDDRADCHKTHWSVHSCNTCPSPGRSWCSPGTSTSRTAHGTHSVSRGQCCNCLRSTPELLCPASPVRRTHTNCLTKCLQFTCNHLILQSVFSSRWEGVLPPPCLDSERVTSLRVLGVIVNDKLTAADPRKMLLSSRSSLLYAMRILRSHGTPTVSLHDIFQAVVVSRIQYVAPARSGMTFRLPTERAWTCYRVVWNGLAIVAMTSRPSPNCSTQLMMTSSTASKPTLHTFSISHTFLSRLTFHIISALVPMHNMTMVNKTTFLNDNDLMLHKHSYWLPQRHKLVISLILCGCVWKLVLNKYVMLCSWLGSVSRFSSGKQLCCN